LPGGWPLGNSFVPAPLAGNLRRAFAAHSGFRFRLAKAPPQTALPDLDVVGDRDPD
jgi:hypothetical protein